MSTTLSRLARVVLLAAFLFGLFWVGINLLHPVPDLAKARQRASDLQALIHQQPQFAEVHVEPLTNAQLTVLAPDELPPAAKAELEHLVATHAPKGTDPVHYLRLITPTAPGNHPAPSAR